MINIRDEIYPGFFDNIDMKLELYIYKRIYQQLNKDIRNIVEDQIYNRIELKE